MPDNGLSFSVVWADEDVLELEVAVRFGVWAGAGRMYVAREALSGFAETLTAVAKGGTSATLTLGQSDLGYGKCSVFEYGRSRRLGMDVLVGHGGGMTSNRPDHPRVVRVAIPIEREGLSQFAIGIQQIIRDERGVVRLPSPSDWP